MRRLLCAKCERTVLPGYMKERGWEKRVVLGLARKPRPQDRVVTETTTTAATAGGPSGTSRTMRQLDPDFYNCDDCGAKINPGDKTVALSMWREGSSQPAWESNFVDPRPKEETNGKES